MKNKNKELENSVIIKTRDDQWIAALLNYLEVNYLEEFNCNGLDTPQKIVDTFSVMLEEKVKTELKKKNIYGQNRA